MADVLVECSTVPGACKDVHDRCPEYNAKPEPVGQQCRLRVVRVMMMMIRFQGPAHVAAVCQPLKELPANGALVDLNVEHWNQQLILAVRIGHLHNTQPVSSLYGRTDACACRTMDRRQVAHITTSERSQFSLRNESTEALALPLSQLVGCPRLARTND